jgi:hypothetical protein
VHSPDKLSALVSLKTSQLRLDSVKTSFSGANYRQVPQTVMHKTRNGHLRSSYNTLGASHDFKQAVMSLVS